jgi:hypothetical protein
MYLFLKKYWIKNVQLLNEPFDYRAIGKDDILALISLEKITEEMRIHVSISLRPKTEIAQHYIDKYKMNITGMTLSLEVPKILELIELYDHD